MDANTLAMVALSDTLVQVVSFLLGGFTSMAFVAAFGSVEL